MPGPSPFQQPDDPIHDLGPWIEAPSSSRVSDYRFDYAAGELQVRWTNRPPTQGYVYRGCTTQLYQQFARAVSKGKMVNRVLNGLPYEPMSPDQINAPSNPNRNPLTSRVIH